jgi:SAM-dependent methyltransferase
VARGERTMIAPPDPIESFRGEEDRIRAAYAARRDDGRYSWLSPGHLFLKQEQEREFLGLLRRAGYADLGPLRVLDVGCGTGDWLRKFVMWGARPEHLTGLDLLEDRVTEARQTCAPGVTIRQANAASIDERDATFDIVMQFTVFTSILDEALRHRVAAEMLRVAKPDGLIVWYDYFAPSLSNPDVRSVNASEIHRLFPGCRITLRRVTLVPPVARLLAGRAWWACELLDKIPLLRTHYLGSIQKGRSR